ncbi:hypothetical protein DBT_1832 [Dissulfuribacter thermophilus]|uniref:HTH cro/C1-type domain-containing protein n=1 Tax=Dissulfuribacter thermophilus TaxID=1156395 RepID=A0A1B9F4C0_9BACT|nr:helix-turn-helix transcriptional regulator [Dissulfuribacter thermophilus]OCC14772.1 hypothetical protein DBT_1832 [Dissulfuribacter thermophilus]
MLEIAWRFANEKIAERRLDLGLSKRALAKKASISEVSFRRIEAGVHQARASSLAGLAEALQVEPGYFFEDYASNRDELRKEKGEGNGSNFSDKEGDQHQEGRGDRGPGSADLCHKRPKGKRKPV